MADEPSLAGFEVTGRVPEAAPAETDPVEVWRAVEVATGDAVELRRLPGGPVVAGRLQRDAAVLAGLDDPHLVTPRAIVDTGDAVVVVVPEPAGGRLAGILAARDRLSAAELITVLAPLAGALAAAHARGLTHGGLTIGTIGFTADGRPLLGEVGEARALDLRPPGDADAEPGIDSAGPPGDVWALAAVGFRALAGRPPPDLAPVGLAELAAAAPPALVAAIESGLRSDPADRPDAAGLAAALLRSGAAAPVRLVRRPLPPAAPPSRASAGVPPAVVPAAALPTVVPAAAPPSVADRPTALDPAPRRTGTVRRRAALGLLASVGLVVVVIGGIATAHHGRDGAAPLPATSAPLRPATPIETATGVRSWTPPAPRPARPPSWEAVVAQLDAARASAFAYADQRRLGQVYAPRAAGRALDRAAIRRLQQRGRQVRGLHTEVEQVRPIAVRPRRVRLRVVDRLSGYRVVARDGHAVRRGRGRPARPSTVVLVRPHGRWRVAAVRRQRIARSAASTSS